MIYKDKNITPDHPKGYLTRFNERTGIWEFKKRFRFRDDNDEIRQTETGWLPSIEECEAVATVRRMNFFKLYEKEKTFDLTVSVPESMYKDLQNASAKLGTDINGFVSKVVELAIKTINRED